MNIFTIEYKNIPTLDNKQLDNKHKIEIDWIRSGQTQDDLRTVKMVTETTQLLCTALNINLGKQVTKYKTAHQQHPCSKWTRASYSNWCNLLTHGMALSFEYTKRFGKIHGCHNTLLQLNQWNLFGYNNTTLEDIFPIYDPTPVHLCIPEEYIRENDPVLSYRLFYASKPNIRYKRQQPPTWFTDMRTLPYESSTGMLIPS